MENKTTEIFSTHAELMVSNIISILGREKAPKFYYNNRDMTYWLSGKFDMLDILKLKAAFIEMGMPEVIVLNQSIMNTYRKADKNNDFAGIYEGDEVRPVKG